MSRFILFFQWVSSYGHTGRGSAEVPGITGAEIKSRLRINLNRQSHSTFVKDRRFSELFSQRECQQISIKTVSPPDTIGQISPFQTEHRCHTFVLIPEAQNRIGISLV